MRNRGLFRLSGLAAVIVILAVMALLPIGASHGGIGNEVTETSTGVRLVMIGDRGCPYCARWDEEVGAAYAASAEGRFAPLLRIDRRDVEAAGFKDVIYSPTFIVVRDGVEVGRIVGYPGPDFFWGLLAKILERADFDPRAGSA